MRCVIIQSPGPENTLALVEESIPSPGSQELLIRVHATALNRADLLQRQGKYPPPAGASTIPGLEVAGEVVKTGGQISQFKPGDRIYGLVAGGGYAEYCCVHQHLAQIIPDEWSYEFAAAIPEALITAHATAFELGQLAQEQTFLIHGAGSGISTTAIQMAHIVGCRIITTVGSDEKRKKAEAMGPLEVINYRQQNPFQLIADQSVDVIVDFIGGDYFPEHLRKLKTLGRLIQIAGMKGYHVECNLLPVLQKRLNIMGFVLRSQSIEEKSGLWVNAHNQWFQHYLDQKLKPVIDSIYPLEKIENAHQRMQSSAHFGKIIVKII